MCKLYKLHPYLWRFDTAFFRNKGMGKVELLCAVIFENNIYAQK